MRMVSIALALVMMIGFAVAAFSQDEKAEVDRKGPRFAIHLVEDPTNWSKASERKIEDLQLSDEPIITEDDVVTYVKELGEFVLKPGWKNRLPEDRRGPFFLFVVSLEGRRWFLGSFLKGRFSLGLADMPAAEGLQPVHKPRLEDAIVIEGMPKSDQLRTMLMELDKYTAILPKEEDQRFAIYLIKPDPQVPRDEMEKLPLDQLELEDEPIVTDKDVWCCDWKTQRFALRRGVDVTGRIGRQVISQSFVVVAMGERCYQGSFNTLISSYAPRVPVIPGDPWELKKGIQIKEGLLKGAADPRFDERMRKGLGPLVREDEDARADSLMKKAMNLWNR